MSWVTLTFLGRHDLADEPTESIIAVLDGQRANGGGNFAAGSGFRNCERDRRAVADQAVVFIEVDVQFAELLPAPGDGPAGHCGAVNRRITKHDLPSERRRRDL